MLTTNEKSILSDWIRSLKPTIRSNSTGLAMKSFEFGLYIGRKRSAHLLETLKSIAANTCCDKCREAGLVASAAISKAESLAVTRFQLQQKNKTLTNRKNTQQ